jgi:nucleoside-diphosphate-sugar epimerase
MSKYRILLTGASGFLGSHLLESLLNKGYKVVILKRTTSSLWRIEHLLNKVKAYDADLRSLQNIFEEQSIDCVIHTVCHYGRDRVETSVILESNLMLGLRLLDLALEYQVKTYINTDTLLPRNINAYALSKKQLVDWLEFYSNNIQVINIKLEHIYGPKDDSTKFVYWVLSQFRENIPEIKLTLGEQKRDFTYIDDVVSAYLTILKNKDKLAGFNEFDIGSGKLISVREFIENLKVLYEKKNGKKSITRLNFGQVPYREGEVMTVCVDNQPLLDLGWSPKTILQDGLHNILETY